MIDASIIEAPHQRNTDDEKEVLKEGHIPEEWAARPAELRQKVRDGRWTLKRGRGKRRANSLTSRPRSGVAHVFAFQKHHMHLIVRTIGFARAKTKIGISNIGHTMRRLMFWEA